MPLKREGQKNAFSARRAVDGLFRWRLLPSCPRGPTVRRDRVDAFDEIRAASGCLGLLRGKELMQILLNCANRSALFGHHLTPKETHYFPRNYTPFTLEER